MTDKYGPLRRFLSDFGGDEWQASFSEIEEILQDRLPSSARSKEWWWANTKNDRRVQARRGWLAAGWEATAVDLAGQSLTFLRASSGVRERTTTRAPNDRIAPNRPKAGSPPVATADVICLLDCEFGHAALIEPERKPDGTLLEITHEFPRDVDLNPHGKGPFCRFHVQGLPRTSGIYAVTVEGALAYIGKAENLAERWGSNGHARIYARNCKWDGRSTNCKVNSYILRESRCSRSVDLWIHQVPSPGPVEHGLIRQLNPPWNGRVPPVTP